MKKIFYISILAALTAFAGLVIAATLLHEYPATMCHDFDGGLNFNVSSSIVYENNLTGDWGFLNDYCLSNITVVEYACKTNTTGIYAQEWSQSCKALNKTCVSGRCA